ncbi:hypothetical protein Bca52824_010218 [Brassica carinata]|uniref:Uncharacterized protein n=1 Tax=Brassica carinata TaxID=52824 RepID=A0A8X8B9X8_BRACI|nr:hypothetical protein Bca52824_010218 [Brassica carinata]
MKAAGGKGASEKEGTEDIENKKESAELKRRKTAENKARLAEERKEAADLKKKLKAEIKQEVPKEERVAV